MKFTPVPIAIVFVASLTSIGLFRWGLSYDLQPTRSLSCTIGDRTEQCDVSRSKLGVWYIKTSKGEHFLVAPGDRSDKGTGMFIDQGFYSIEGGYLRSQGGPDAPKFTESYLSGGYDDWRLFPEWRVLDQSSVEVSFVVDKGVRAKVDLPDASIARTLGGRR